MKARRPRILFYLSGLATGGAERHALDLRRGFDDLGYATELIVHGRHVSSVMAEHPGARGARILGVRRMSDPTAALHVCEAFRKAAPDIVFSVNQSAAIWTAVLKLVGVVRAPSVCVFHTTVPGPRDRAILPAFRIALRLTDVLVYVSRNQQSYWRDRGLRPRDDCVIVNGIDLGRFHADVRSRSAARQRLGVAAGDYVVGFLGAFRPEKNQIELVEAVARLKVRGVRASAVFIGDGPTRAATAARTKALSIDDRVLFLGDRADVAALIPGFDVGVLCSTAVETFSLAALEMLVSGVPVVMTEIGGASEIVSPGHNGWLYPPRDVEALTERLLDLSVLKTREMLRSAARASAERFSAERMMSGYLELVATLTGQG